MAIEAKRGCGYRKVGGTYLVGDGDFTPCDRLPFELRVCPCCGEGYRPSRGLRKIDPWKMLGNHETEVLCACGPGCPMCYPPMGELDNAPGHYLEWIGQQHYSSAAEFAAEALAQGISRRLKGGIPRDLVVGQSVVYLAYREMPFKRRVQNGSITRTVRESVPGIFTAFVPRRIEHIVTESEEATAEQYKGCSKEQLVEFGVNQRVEKIIGMIHRGVSLVAVPDDDPDHQ